MKNLWKKSLEYLIFLVQNDMETLEYEPEDYVDELIVAHDTLEMLLKIKKDNIKLIKNYEI